MVASMAGGLIYGLNLLIITVTERVRGLKAKREGSHETEDQLHI